MYSIVTENRLVITWGSAWGKLTGKGGERNILHLDYGVGYMGAQIFRT